MLIGELAKATGMSKDGIRHYEALGILVSTRRQAGSRWYCDYDESSPVTIERVRQAQQLGLSLQEIAELLKIYGERDMSLSETMVFLDARLAVIREKIARLRTVEDFIVAKMARYRQGEGQGLGPDAC